MSRLPVLFYQAYAFLYRIGVPFLPRILMYLNRLVFGVYLPPSCVIGSGSRLGYGGLGVVVHARAIVGKNCTIGPGVVIGGRSRRYTVPVIGDNVYISAGAKVLGDVVIGDNSVIGANAVVISSVMSNTIVAGVPAKVVRENINPEDYQ